MDGTLRPETLGDVIPAATLGMRPPWLASQLPHSARLPFGPGDGFDVYVDRAVFCPDNLGMSKVVFKLMDASYTVLGDPMEKASRLDCSLIEPEYGAHSAFRPGLASVHSRGAELGSSGRLSEGASAAEDADHGPASLAGRTEQEAWDWDPSLTLVFRIDGLDAHTHKLHAAGYAVLNVLDLDVPTVRQVIALFAAERTEGKVTRGLEDIPSPIATDDVILQWLNDVLDKLPLSMLDFRYICPYSSEEGLCVSVDGVSNSPLGKLLRVACCPIAGARSDPVPLLSGTAARRSSKRRGAGEPRLLGRNSKVTSLALEAGEMGAPAEWLAPKQQATGDPAAAIEDEAGPASDATPWFACHEANWAAPQSLQAFRDDFVHLREPFHPTTCLFFRLFAAEPFAGGHSVQVEAVGWAVMPVFDKRGDGYTRRGAFVVPVLAGPAPPPWLVERLAADPTKIDSLIKDLVAGTTGERDAPPPLLIPPSEPVSILVRLQDGQLSDLIPIPTSKYSAALVPKPVRSRFQLSARMPYHRQQARLSVTLPRDLSPSDADEALVRARASRVVGAAGMFRRLGAARGRV
ncbi:hypothetical protein FNF31_01770 [Cafeteria roenbergensis]|uniref:Uncharacterized protein n=1 Tax=Cafeteria roenbergensis TaxID=33653 RepID=A0A5A8DJU7_CAFRO|nr:hypothetical protein FNF31_01770 [Cafeteria roenbergensis]